MVFTPLWNIWNKAIKKQLLLVEKKKKRFRTTVERRFSSAGKMALGFRLFAVLS